MKASGLRGIHNILRSMRSMVEGLGQSFLVSSLGIFERMSIILTMDIA